MAVDQRQDWTQMVTKTERAARFLIALLFCVTASAAKAAPVSGVKSILKSGASVGADQMDSTRGQAIASADLPWRSPEDLVEMGFKRSRVVIMNEAHSGLLRCVRTRLIGKRVLAAAHAQGVRHIAMEALNPKFAEEANKTRKVPKANGYLSQPEMISFIQSALDLGWTLIPYEAQAAQSPIIAALGPRPADPQDAVEFDRKFQETLLSKDYTNWREMEQAKNLVSSLKALPDNGKLFVWCGNSHHKESLSNNSDWIPMGYQFIQLSGLDPFTIDQTRTVEFAPGQTSSGSDLARKYARDLAQLGGTAGFLKQEAPEGLKGISFDAVLLSTDNRLE